MLSLLATRFGENILLQQFINQQIKQNEIKIPNVKTIKIISNILHDGTKNKKNFLIIISNNMRHLLSLLIRLKIYIKTIYIFLLLTVQIFIFQLIKITHNNSTAVICNHFIFLLNTEIFVIFFLVSRKKKTDFNKYRNHFIIYYLIIC